MRHACGITSMVGCFRRGDMIMFDKYSSLATAERFFELDHVFYMQCRVYGRVPGVQCRWTVTNTVAFVAMDRVDGAVMWAHASDGVVHAYLPASIAYA